jgi:hypothetical protein
MESGLQPKGAGEGNVYGAAGGACCRCNVVVLALTHSMMMFVFSFLLFCVSFMWLGF